MKSTAVFGLGYADFGVGFRGQEVRGGQNPEPGIGSTHCDTGIETLNSSITESEVWPGA